MPVPSVKLLGAIWFVGLCFGFADLARFETIPGIAATAPTEWPSGVNAEPATDRLTVVMALHPKCACSLASLEGLARLTALFPNGFETRLLFYTPADKPKEWAFGKSWDAAERIPGALRILDPKGDTARQFGATTSGHVVVYSPEGRLLYSGGITPSRGHAGDSVGLTAITELLRNERPTVSTAPTFGCSLQSKSSIQS